MLKTKGKLERFRSIGIAEGNRLLTYLHSTIKLKEIRYGHVPNAKYATKELAMASSEYTSLMGCYLITQTESKLQITTSWWHNSKNKYMKPCTWSIDLNGLDTDVYQGFKMYAEFNKAAKIQKLEDKDYNKLHKDECQKYVESAKPILGYKGDNKLHIVNNCYEYDLNSAYSSVILKGIPDLEHPRFKGTVRSGEVGFINNRNLDICHKNMYADIIFPIIECPEAIREYITKWYGRKANAKCVEDKNRAKAYLNLPIGYSQRTNPYFRAYVVEECNRVIQNILSKYDCVLWNTDAIITTEPIQMDLGTGIGQWKYEEIKELRYLGNTYQIDNDLPKYRGVVKSWFTNFAKINRRPWKLGIDKIPTNLNCYAMDWENYKLRENINEEK